ncbi:energy transducer TonB [Kordia sp. YSTF-M3]|uniref:Energy transducer TonB n=1 Tax=Kordia aestuariivivens TaxID=2759037 RepID=A0ABR7Q3F6_9FLAO|nr:energy transducer TonB [Kordia aestuariivivens]MBC8753085.1 energy transducer TonB [Kordia aestuariivivens]
MEAKKNPDVDLRKNSVFYLALGLALVTFLIWQGMEWTAYDEVAKEEVVDMIENDDEEMIMTQQQIQPPPPPPPPAPEIIEVVEDEEEVEETVIESAETSEEEVIQEVETVEIEEEEEIIEDVPFSVIEDAPIFPGCEKYASKKERKKCMSEQVQKHVNKKFNTELASDLDLEGVQKIFVVFKIDRQGNITDVRSRAPHPRLAKEAEKVIRSLPKMKPGKQRGKPVGVNYTLPIVFKVQ